MSRLQQNVASHMQYTWTVAPHVSTVTQIDMSAVVARRLALKEEFEVRLLMLPLFLTTHHCRLGGTGS